MLTHCEYMYIFYNILVEWSHSRWRMRAAVNDDAHFHMRRAAVIGISELEEQHLDLVGWFTYLKRYEDSKALSASVFIRCVCIIYTCTLSEVYDWICMRRPRCCGTCIIIIFLRPTCTLARRSCRALGPRTGFSSGEPRSLLAVYICVHL